MGLRWDLDVGGILIRGRADGQIRVVHCAAEGVRPLQHVALLKVALQRNRPSDPFGGSPFGRWEFGGWELSSAAQVSNPRRNFSPFCASASCEGSNDLQIAAARAIVFTLLVNDSMTTGPS